MSDQPAGTWPDGEIVVTSFHVVADQQRSRTFYCDVLGARLIRAFDPVVLDLYGTVLILNEGGPPTDDKPGVWLAPPSQTETETVSAFLNIRVRDIAVIYQRWQARGAHWLTPPQDRGAEIRAYLHDPDGHLIEVGQAT